MNQALTRYILQQQPEIDANTLFMWRAELAATKSRCDKRQVGACIAKDGEIISVGWNRAPDEVRDCLDHEDYKKCYRDHLRSQKEREEPDKEIPAEELDLGEYERVLIDNIKDETERRGYLNRVALDVIDGYYHDFKTLEACRALHAEETAMLDALEKGRNITEATLYTTTYPCMACAKKIAQLRIKEIYFIEPYPIEGARKLLEERGVRQYRYQGFRLSFAPRILNAINRATRNDLERLCERELEWEEVYDCVFQMSTLHETVNAILGRSG